MIDNTIQQQEYEVHPSISAEMQQAGPQQPPVQEDTSVEQPQQSVQPETQQPKQEHPQEVNYRAIRYELERLQREKEEAYRMLENERAKSQKPQQSQQNYDINIGDDDIIDGKQFKGYVQTMQKQQQDMLEEQRRNHTIMLEAKLRSEMPDIEKVVNADTIESLRTLYPEIASTLASSGDVYTKGKSAYQMIKNLGLYKEDKYEVDRARAQTNSYKPRPLTSVSPQQGESPLSHANAFANGLTEDLKKNLLKEMMESRRKS